MLFLACNELSTSLSCWVSCSTSLLFFFWYCLKHIYCDMLCTALKTWDHWPLEVGFWMCDLLEKHLVFCLNNLVKSQTINLYIRSGETIMLTDPAHNQSIKSVILVWWYRRHNCNTPKISSPLTLHRKYSDGNLLFLDYYNVFAFRDMWCRDHNTPCYCNILIKSYCTS